MNPWGGRTNPYIAFLVGWLQLCLWNTICTVAWLSRHGARGRSLALAVVASLSLLYPCTRGWWVRPSSLTGGYRSNRLYLGVIDIARATKPARGKCKGNDVPSPKRHGGTHAHDVSAILNRITHKNSWCEFHFTSHDTQKLIDLIKLKGQKRFKLSSCTKI